MSWQSLRFAQSAQEAVGFLHRFGPQARPVAGGTDLLVQLRDAPDRRVILIDLSRAPDLHSINLTPDGQALRIGAAATYADILHSELVWAHAPLLAQAAATVGSVQIRARATLGGNLATASPAGDSLPALLVLGARLHLLGPSGARSLPVEQFFQHVRRTALEPGEVITHVELSSQGAQRGAFLKLGQRRSQIISLVSVAAAVTTDADGRVGHARVAFGSVAPTPRRAPQAEAALLGQALTQQTIQQAAQAAAAAAQPIDDVRGSADYRREMVATLTRRVLANVAGEDPPRRPLEQTLSSPLPRAPAPPADWDGRSLRCRVNGQEVHLADVRGQTLMAALREKLDLVGVKNGCSAGECGACTVLMDGVAVTSCLVPAEQAWGREIETVEGLAQGPTLHPLQQAFVDHAASQCGYCTPGMLLAAEALLRHVAQPTREQVQAGLAGNLCRCTGYYQIFDAVAEAAQHQRRERGGQP
ncbi:MAG: 2Fe-2S iron-sulfur cluster binding domain-containing protein [Chloroflexi bacterium]|nr:2Fe-2S iron-sulfur cluster binding domain-containing protein [Chloroflexota bacterium]